MDDLTRARLEMLERHLRSLRDAASDCGLTPIAESWLSAIILELMRIIDPTKQQDI